MLKAQCEVFGVTDDLGSLSSAYFDPPSFMKSKISTATYQDILEHCTLPFAYKFYGDPDSISQQALLAVHTARSTNCFNDHLIVVVDFLANCCGVLLVSWV